MAPKAVKQNEFALYLIEALSDSTVQQKLSDTIKGSFNYDTLADKVGQRLTVRIKLLENQLEEKDHKINELTNRVEELESKMDDQEQYSRRSSVRISGIKETEIEENKRPIIN